MIKRAVFSFIISSFLGLVVYLLIEFFGSVVFGVEGFTGLTPEYLEKFPSETLALGVAVLSHGLIGAVFAVAGSIYEKVEIGFILQNVIYVLHNLRNPFLSALNELGLRVQNLQFSTSLYLDNLQQSLYTKCHRFAQCLCIAM